MFLVGSNCRELGGKIAELSRTNLIEVEVKKFPDNETYVRIPAGVKEKNMTNSKSQMITKNKA